MKVKTFDYPELEINDVIGIYLNEETVESFKVTFPIEIRMEDSFVYENITYFINVSVYDDKSISIELGTEADDSNIDSFSVIIYQDEEEAFFKIPEYVPTAPYTGTLSSALYGLADSSSIVPMIDVENISKFEDYRKDSLIDFKHYLDLSSLKYVTNLEQREQQKERRKEERSQNQNKKMTTPLEPAREAEISMDRRLELFNQLSSKLLVIPVYLWDDDADYSELEFFYTSLKDEGFQNFAIRVVSKNSFKSEAANIFALNNNFIIFVDLNTNFTIPNIKAYLTDLYTYFSNIIYLAAHFLPAQMSIPRTETNRNHRKDNLPLIVYSELLDDFSSLKYGDYCGFDRKTLSSMPKGGRPSARVVLCSLDKSKKVLIRRGWDDGDLTTTQSGEEKIGMIQSMHKLLCDIQRGELDREPRLSGDKFLDENICDADLALKGYCPDRTSPGEIKTLCIRHNIFSVMHNYI